MEGPSHTLWVRSERNLFPEEKYCDFSLPYGAGFYSDQEIIKVKTVIEGSVDEKSISCNLYDSSLNFWGVPICELPEMWCDIDMGNARVWNMSSEVSTKVFNIPYQV